MRLLPPPEVWRIFAKIFGDIRLIRSNLSEVYSNHPFRVRIIVVNDPSYISRPKMYSLKPLLLALLVGTSSAFVKPPTPSLSTALFDAPPDLKSPPALYEGAVAAGAAKAKANWGKIFKLGIASGCHIGFGAYLAITVGGACPGIAAENPGLQKVSSHYFVVVAI